MQGGASVRTSLQSLFRKLTAFATWYSPMAMYSSLQPSSSTITAQQSPDEGRPANALARQTQQRDRQHVAQHAGAEGAAGSGQSSDSAEGCLTSKSSCFQGMRICSGLLQLQPESGSLLLQHIAGTAECFEASRQRACAAAGGDTLPSSRSAFTPTWLGLTCPADAACLPME